MWVFTLHILFLYSDPPLTCHPPSYWLRLFSSQTFSPTNTPTFSNLVILHTYPLMKMEQSVPKRRHIKFRRRATTQKKSYTEVASHCLRGGEHGCYEQSWIKGKSTVVFVNNECNSFLFLYPLDILTVRTWPLAYCCWERKRQTCFDRQM
jgi:hypothetical protein